MIMFDLAVHIGSSVSLLASICVIYLIFQMPERARGTTSTRLVLHMACIEIPMCLARSFGDSASLQSWTCTFQGTILMFNVSVFLMSGCFINNSYLQIYKGWTEYRCYELLKYYLGASYFIGLVCALGALFSGQISHDNSWCAIKDSDQLLNFILFYFWLVMVEIFICWAMYRIVRRVYSHIALMEQTTQSEVGEAQKKNSTVRVKMRRKTLFRAFGFSAVMLLSWGCELVDVIRQALTGTEDTAVVKQIQFVTVPLQGFWYALIFALPILIAHRKKLAQEKANQEKFRTNSAMGITMVQPANRTSEVEMIPSEKSTKGHEGEDDEPKVVNMSSIYENETTQV